SVAFLVVNLLGFATYFIYPVAPPWYVTEYGLGPARLDVLPAAAAASRFDLLLGTHFFDGIYGRGIDVYGAYPSLHVAYPLLVIWATFRAPELRWARAPAIGFFLLMCLSAVYLQHHYVIDVLLGIAYAGATLAGPGPVPAPAPAGRGRRRASNRTQPRPARFVRRAGRRSPRSRRDGSARRRPAPVRRETLSPGSRPRTRRDCGDPLALPEGRDPLRPRPVP